MLSADSDWIKNGNERNPIMRGLARKYCAIVGRLLQPDIGRDVAERLETQAALRLRDRALESADEGIMITDAIAADHPVVYVNPAVERITEYAAAELIGRNARFLVAEETGGPEREALCRLLREHREGSVVMPCRRKSGGLWWNELSVVPARDEAGQITHTISVFKDVTERRRQDEELIRNANHDALTGLPNRILLHDRMVQAIAAAGRHGRQVGVLLVGLDHFKIVNDSQGHDAGDLILQEVGRRLQTCLRDGDTVARLGSDEFVLLLNEVEQEDCIAPVVARVLSILASPFGIAGEEIYLGASIGTSVHPRDGGDGQVLLRRAAIAMNRAKDLGRNNHQGFTDEMQFTITQRLSIETGLRKALERGEFLLYFQPQVSLETGRVVGAEALIRWLHPELGMVSPAQFIPLAEETGLIVPIGEWVLDTACAQARKWIWMERGLSSVAINLSPRQFRQKNLLAAVERSLSAHGLDAVSVEIELTESMVMQDPENTLRILRLMKEMGLRISLDDFGTGYSSLSHLRRFPIDVLKVDQSFVRDVTTDVDAAAIAASIIALARNLKLGVIAEGVETRAQLDFLLEQKCDAFQGYYFSKPLPAEEFTSILANGKCLEGVGLEYRGRWLPRSEFLPQMQIEVA
jgi:diguanylate cyclase (GGDEF)-like protein/PAS domain S-box-containing protein